MHGLFRLVKNICQMAAATVLAIIVGGHEDTSTTLGSRALATETLNLSLSINLVVLEHGQLCLLPTPVLARLSYKP